MSDNPPSVIIFPQGSSGNPNPVATINGDNSHLDAPSGIAIDSAGKIYVTNNPDNAVSSSDYSIAVFAPLGNAGGGADQAPVALFQGTHTGLDRPFAISLDREDNIYVVNNSDPNPELNGNGSIGIYRPLGDRTGLLDEPPTASIIGFPTNLSSPSDVVLDSKGDIYVSNVGGGDNNCGSITVYAPLGNRTGQLDDPPIETIGGSLTQMAMPRGIAVDLNLNIFVSNVEECGNGSNSKAASPCILHLQAAVPWRTRLR